MSGAVASELRAQLKQAHAEVSDLQEKVRRLESAARPGTGLSPDEQAILSYLELRLQEGKETYGSLDLSSDQRDWDKERDEELADAIVYVACAALKRGRTC